MRELRSFDQSEPARALSLMLANADVANELREFNGRHTVWVIENDELPAAVKISQTLNLDALDLAALQREAETKQRAQAADNARGGHREVAVAQRWQRSANVNAPIWTSPITLTFIAICIGLSLLVELSSDGQGLRASLLITPPVPGPGLRVATDFEWTQPWRLLSPIFVHFGFLHLIFNMMYLRRLGAQVEALHGPIAIVAVVVAIAVPSNFCQFLVVGPHFGGMSGVVYGLFGWVWMHQQYAAHAKYTLAASTSVFLMAWMVLCATGLLGPIANVAHGVGLIAGLLLSFPVYLDARKSGRTARCAFEPGNWADVNLTGVTRLRRQWIEPYLPIWLIAIAAAVSATDLLD